ncbi:MAG: oxidoreductase [Spirochaetes bacterium]|nr:MAG: oxidoreductase [Spirochaetota bacterium]
MSSMENKVCLITGGSSGVGKAVATGLAELGAKVILVCRSEERGEKTLAEIAERSGNNNIDLITADLSVQNAVRNLAEEVKGRVTRLHVLSNTAGILVWRREETPDGIEKTLAVDYLSHFLLTGLLLELLKRSAPSRIITVTGGPSILKKARVKLEDLQYKKNWSGIKTAIQAALCREIFTVELSRKIEGSGVTANSFHPGLVKSNLGRNLPQVIRFFANFLQLFLSEKCETGVYLAASPEVKGVSGKFFVNKKPVDIDFKGYTPEIGGKLWRLSEELTGFNY